MSKFRGNIVTGKSMIVANDDKEGFWGKKLHGLAQKVFPILDEDTCRGIFPNFAHMNRYRIGVVDKPLVFLLDVMPVVMVGSE